MENNVIIEHEESEEPHIGRLDGYIPRYKKTLRKRTKIMSENEHER